MAIEQRKKFAQYLAAKTARRGHTNLVALQGDARLLAPRLFASGSLSAIHVHFPDPWWKRRHHGRRLVDDRMSVLLYRLLSPGGLFDFRTDVEEYALSAVERLEECGFTNECGPGRFAETREGESPPPARSAIWPPERRSGGSGCAADGTGSTVCFLQLGSGHGASDNHEQQNGEERPDASRERPGQQGGEPGDQGRVPRGEQESGHRARKDGAARKT